MTIYRLKTLLAWLAVLCSLQACADKDRAGGAVGALESTPAAKNNWLAYQHHINLQTEAEQVPAIFKRLIAVCSAAPEQQCQLLESKLNTSEYVSSSLKFRAPAATIQQLMAATAELGQVTEQATTAEDLQAPIADTEKQSQLLLDYRQRLEGLRERAKNDLDALIKVNKELAQVQAEIEAISGKAAHLRQRVNTEILSIQVSGKQSRSFATPLKLALRDFSSNLAQAVAGLITVLAFLLPWLGMLLLGSIVLPKLWRRWHKKTL